MLLLTNRARTWSSMLFTTLTATRKQRQKSTEHCMYPNVFVYVGLSELHVKCIEGLSQHLAQYYGWNTYMSVSANTALRALVLQGCFSSTSTIFRRYRGTLQRDMAAICFGDCYRSTASFYLHHVLRKSICIHRNPHARKAWVSIYGLMKAQGDSSSPTSIENHQGATPMH